MTIGESLLTKSIISGNLKAVKIKGVGTKTLEKIVLELSSKFKENPKYQSIASISEMGNEGDTLKSNESFEKDETDKLEIFEALQNLGFKVNEISESYKKIEAQKDSDQFSSQEIIKLMLQYLRNR